MQVLATYKFARISAFKAREVTREIQGLPVNEALHILKWTPKKAAGLVHKTLRSAIANAENNNDLRAEDLVVQEAVVGEGATMRRFRPRARGSAGPIRKRTSHIRITLTDEIKIAPPKEKPSEKKTKKAAPAGAQSKTSSRSASKDQPKDQAKKIKEVKAETSSETGAEVISTEKAPVSQEKPTVTSEEKSKE